MSFRPRLLAVLVPLALAGCASQEALTEQSQSTQARLDRLEQSVRTLSDLGQVRHEALNKEIAGLKAAIQGLNEHAARTDAGLDKLAQASREAGEQAEAERLKLAERVTQGELRLDELATAVNGSANRSESDQARLAERLGQVEKRLDEVATGLPERLNQTEKRLDGLAASVDEALVLARQEQIRLNGKEAFTILLTEDKTLYPINSPELGSQDAGKLDGLMARLAELGKEYHLEIQGHTDNIGTEDYNYELGKARADVVKRYLHEKKAIPLSQMSVISFGAASPGDRNSYHNRRILIRVLVPK
ncbi:MAG: OmpA family protein [Thiobacillus sp.]|nr:OmpA family protein [Thiobacillus sp.]